MTDNAVTESDFSKVTGEFATTSRQNLPNLLGRSDPDNVDKFESMLMNYHHQNHQFLQLGFPRFSYR